MIWLAWIGAYFIAGLVGGSIVSYEMRMESSGDDRIMGTLTVFLLWPLALIVLVGWVIFKGVYLLCCRTGQFVGHRAHAHRITENRTEMMEADMGRTGGQDVLVLFDYVACKTCYGSGCTTCDQKGVVRQRTARTAA